MQYSNVHLTSCPKCGRDLDVVEVGTCSQAETSTGWIHTGFLSFSCSCNYKGEKKFASEYRPFWEDVFVVSGRAALETKENFETAHFVAQELAREERVTDETVTKVMCYLCDNDIETFFKLLRTIADAGKSFYVIQSIHELDEYRKVLRVLEKYLLTSTKEEAMFIFGWARRLRMYYVIYPEHIPGHKPMAGIGSILLEALRRK